MSHKAFILDLEGVILHINYQKTFDQFKKYGLKVEYDKTFSQLVERYDSGQLTTEKMYAEFVEQYCAANPISFEQFVKAWNAMLLYIPDPNIEYLFRLKASGYIILLLSNINALHAENVCETYGEIFQKLFDKTFYSFETGILKPDPKAFHTAMDYLRRKDVTEEQTLFIDDTSANIKTAAELKVTAIKYPMNGEEKQKPISIRSKVESYLPLRFYQPVKHDKRELVPFQSQVALLNKP